MFYVCLFLYLISNYCCYNTTQKVINGVRWIDDRHGPSPVVCDTVTLVFTLIRYFAIVFYLFWFLVSNVLLIVQWLSVWYLFNSWVIWNHNKLETSLILKSKSAYTKKDCSHHLYCNKAMHINSTSLIHIFHSRLS